jgi:glycosyltransferase involved in cell wall biosynthesis
MKILWLTHRDIRNPQAGGVERATAEITSRLAGLGDEVAILCGGYRGAPSVESIDGVRIHRFGHRLLPHLAEPIATAEEAPDVVVNDLGHVIPWFSPWFGTHPGVCFFHHLHARTLDGQVRPPFAGALKWIERQYPILYPNWPFVVESESSLQDLADLGVPATRCALIRPGVDADLFRPGAMDSRPTLIYFGGMKAYKRPVDALVVHKELRDRGWDCRLVVIGSGPALNELKRAIARLGTESSVQFCGRLTLRQLATQIGEAWVNLHPAVAEGWCLSALEAASCGVPTVCYDVPGMRDSVANEISGIVVADPARVALTDATERILKAPEKWRRSSRAYSSQFTWDRTASEWHTYLQQTLNNPPRSLRQERRKTGGSPK